MPTRIKTIEALGWTADETHVGLRLTNTDGTTQIVELPVTELEQMSLLMKQLAHKSAERSATDYNPPLLSVAKWELGENPGGDIPLRFHLPVAGAYGFGLSADLALSLLEGLQRATGGEPARGRPN